MSGWGQPGDAKLLCVLVLVLAGSLSLRDGRQVPVLAGKTEDEARNKSLAVEALATAPLPRRPASPWTCWAS